MIFQLNITMFQSFLVKFFLFPLVSLCNEPRAQRWSLCGSNGSSNELQRRPPYSQQNNLGFPQRIYFSNELKSLKDTVIPLAICCGKESNSFTLSLPGCVNLCAIYFYSPSSSAFHQDCISHWSYSSQLTMGTLFIQKSIK